MSNAETAAGEGRTRNYLVKHYQSTLVASFLASALETRTISHNDIIMRTIVDLPEEQIKALDQYSRAEGISRAEAVRRAVARFLPTKPKSKNWLNKHPAIGTWPHGNSDNWVANPRDEWPK